MIQQEEMEEEEVEEEEEIEEGVEEEDEVVAEEVEEEGDETEIEVMIAEIEIEVVVEVEAGQVIALTVDQIETLQQVVKVREVTYVIIVTNQATLPETARIKL